LTTVSNADKLKIADLGFDTPRYVGNYTYFDSDEYKNNDSKIIEKHCDDETKRKLKILKKQAKVFLNMKKKQTKSKKFNITKELKKIMKELNKIQEFNSKQINIMKKNNDIDLNNLLKEIKAEHKRNLLSIIDDVRKKEEKLNKLVTCSKDPTKVVGRFLTKVRKNSTKNTTKNTSWWKKKRGIPSLPPVSLYKQKYMDTKQTYLSNMKQRFD
jgi:hypothetical protein